MLRTPPAWRGRSIGTTTWSSSSIPTAPRGAIREALAVDLRALGLEVVPSVTNFLLCHLPAEAPPAAAVLARCREQGLYLRDAGTISSLVGDRAFRAAVKDAETNARIVSIL